MYHAPLHDWHNIPSLPAPRPTPQTFGSLREQMEVQAKARAALVKERDEARKRAEGCDGTIVALVQDRLTLKQQASGAGGRDCAAGTRHQAS
jgi:hypothetical protein